MTNSVGSAYIPSFATTIYLFKIILKLYIMVDGHNVHWMLLIVLRTCIAWYERYTIDIEVLLLS
jgi:hypothetical protein